MSTFKDYVTGTSFALTLSRRQIEMICQLDQFGSSYGFISTFGALVGKGLAERRTDTPEKVHLTEAGKAVIPLIRLAGLYVEYPPIPEPVELPPISVRLKERAE